MADHDQRFKLLLEEFFPEFFQLFFPPWAERFDFTQIEWLKQEAFTDPTQGERLYLDVVAKLKVRQPLEGQRPGEAASWIAVIHVEVESAETVAPLRARMHDYRSELRQRHRLPVLSIGLYLRVGLDGIGWDVYEEYFWEHRLLRFEYPYIGLPALDGEGYVTGENILGVALAALMRLPEERRVELRAEAIRRLAASEQNSYRRYLLVDCVEAYWPLSGPQRQEYDELMRSERYKGVRPMVTTIFDEVRYQERRDLLRMQLETRFGTLSPQAQQRLKALTPERMRELAIAFARGQSLQDMGLED